MAMERKSITLIVLGVLAVAAVAVGIRALTSNSASEVQSLSAEVPVHFDDTGDEIKMNRGQIERSVLARIFHPGPIDAAVGLTNPKTGKPTGFPVDRAYWDRLIEEAKKAAELNKKK